MSKIDDISEEALLENAAGMIREIKPSIDWRKAEALATISMANSLLLIAKYLKVRNGDIK